MKFGFLDGLRGLAALIVVIDHFAISFFPAATDGSVQVTHGAFESVIEKTPLHIFVSGNFSVCVFFILSGIVLSAKFFRTGDTAVVVASAIKRYSRLAIPVLACVMLAYILMTSHAFFNASAAQVTGSTWLGGFWRFEPNLLGAIYHGAAGVFIKGSSNYNTVLWTMKTELIGSFLVFALLLFVGKFRFRSLVYVALGLLLIKTYYVTFIFGVALCDGYYHRGTASKSLMHPVVWVPLVALSIFLASCPVGTLDGTLFHHAQGLLPSGMSVTTTAHMLGALGIVAAILYTPTLQGFLAMKPMLYLGKTSFALYLTHFFIIGSLSSYLFAILAPGIGYRTAFIITLIPSAILIGLVAHWFTRFVDGPAIRLSGKLYRAMFRAKTASPPSRLAPAFPPSWRHETTGLADRNQ